MNQTSSVPGHKPQCVELLYNWPSWENFTNYNVASDQCPASALDCFLQRLGTRCENDKQNKQPQKKQCLS